MWHNCIISNCFNAYVIFFYLIIYQTELRTSVIAYANTTYTSYNVRNTNRLCTIDLK